jgi:hypothetical protein
VGRRKVLLRILPKTEKHHPLMWVAFYTFSFFTSNNQNRLAM